MRAGSDLSVLSLSVVALSNGAGRILVASLPFSLRHAYPLLAEISGGLGVLVVVYLILARVLRRRQ